MLSLTHNTYIQFDSEIFLKYNYAKYIVFTQRNSFRLMHCLIPPFMYVLSVYLVLNKVFVCILKRVDEVSNYESRANFVQFQLTNTQFRINKHHEGNHEIKY